jgi:hypothetical protein
MPIIPAIQILFLCFLASKIEFGRAGDACGILIASYRNIVNRGGSIVS